MTGRFLPWCVATAVLSPLRAPQPTVEQQTSGTNARLQAVWAVDDQVVWASGTHGAFTRTIDGGAHWQAGTVPGADSLEFRDLHGFDANRAVLLASGNGDKSRLYLTTDGGKSWSLTFTNTVAAAFYDCLDFRGPVGIVVSDAVEGRFPLLQSTDGGKSWHSYQPPGSEAIRAIDGEGAFAASGTCLAQTRDGSAWISTAKGGRVIRFGPQSSEGYQTPAIHGPATAGLSTIAFRNDRLGIAAGGDLARPDDFTDNVITTVDGGKTWAIAGRPAFPGSIFGVAYVPSRPMTVVAVSPKGASWSVDNGKTWQPLDQHDYWGISFSKAGTGWIGGPGGRIARIRF